MASNIAYLPFGPVSSLTLGNGVQVTYSYDLDYRLTRIQAQAPGGGAMLQDLTLAFDGEACPGLDPGAISRVASRFLRTFGFQAVAVSVSVSLCFNKSMSM